MLSGCVDISALTHTRAQGTAYSPWVVAVFAPGNSSDSAMTVPRQLRAADSSGAPGVVAGCAGDATPGCSWGGTVGPRSLVVVWERPSDTGLGDGQQEVLAYEVEVSQVCRRMQCPCPTLLQREPT
jgi:hypothetical protein